RQGDASSNSPSETFGAAATVSAAALAAVAHGDELTTEPARNASHVLEHRQHGDPRLTSARQHGGERPPGAGALQPRARRELPEDWMLVFHGVALNYQAIGDACGLQPHVQQRPAGEDREC